MSTRIFRFAPLVAAPLLFALGGAAHDEHARAGATSLDDPQVLGVLVAVNQGEVDFSKQGIEKAHDPEVKGFATDMVTVHSAALTHVQSTLVSSKLTQESSSVTAQLQADVKKADTALAKVDAGGDAYDLAFMCAEVRLHEGALATIDGSLMPAARAQDVREELRATRPVVSEHLHMAEAIVQRLGADESAVSGAHAGKTAAAARSHEDPAPAAKRICKAHGGA